MDAAIVARHLVMIAGHIDDLGPFARHAQDLLHHVVVRLRPVPAALQLPSVEDVADQIEPVALDVADEVEQKLGLTAARAQMDVGDEDGPIVANGDLGAHRRRSLPLRSRRLG